MSGNVRTCYAEISGEDRNGIPAHSVETWQDVKSVFESSQYLPSPCGRGLSHARVRVMLPSPHVTPHAPQAPHAPQEPSTDVKYSVMS